MRWPAAWTDPAKLDLLKDTGVDNVLVGNGPELEAVRSRARQMGLRVVHPDSPPDGVKIVKGEWPGVRNTRGAGGASAGPTGAAWVDSNGWVAMLAAVMHPNDAAWIDAAPGQRVSPGAYLMAVADTASHGGRWIVQLDNNLAGGIASGNASAMNVWGAIGKATAFFAAHKTWEQYRPAAIVGVISDFTGDNEFFAQEQLNLLARAGAHNVALKKEGLTAAQMRGLKAVTYADAKAPSPVLRKEIMAFVEGGGLLLTTPVWGPPSGSRNEHPRFAIARAGKGRIATTIEAPDDPWQFSNDAVIVVSHRHDLVRFWNAGACGSYYAISPDGKQAVVHLLFYADRGPDSATVRVSGPFRKAKAMMVDAPEIPGVKAEAQKDGVEVYLPQVSQYVALELSL